MSEGIEAIIKTAKGVREARDYSGTASITTANNKTETDSVFWKKLLYDWGAGAAIPVAVLAVWQLAGSAGWISPEFLPAPLTILSAFADLAVRGELLHHLGVSIGRAGTGFLIGGFSACCWGH